MALRWRPKAEHFASTSRSYSRCRKARICGADSWECVGTIVCKLDAHGRERVTHRGYIAMLAVRQDYRKKGIGATLSASSPPPVPHCRSRGRCCAGSSLVVMALDAMRTAHADEVRQLTGAAPARR